MEDSQVLDAESKAAPLQAPEAIQETSASIEPQNETPNKNIYGGPSPVVGEKNHAADITANMNRSDMSYKGAVDESKEPTVSTVSTTKGNVTQNVEWKAHYGMADTYKATDKEDYSWNKIAKERAQSEYEQEATQVLSDYAKSMQQIKEAGSEAMNQYFSAAYGANQTADKMGWSGGQVTSNDAKTAFLKASTAANMYDKYELQKYGVESQLTVARMYAEANMEKLALDMYQDEVDKADREAQLTGWYISPEASEIMKQQKVAEEIKNNKNATEAERKRAEQVIGAGNAYFDKLGFEKDEYGHYKGVKILQQKEYEETVRANHENERLQKDANDIAREGVKQQKRANDISEEYNKKNYQLMLRQTEATEYQNALREGGTYTNEKAGTSYSNQVKINGQWRTATDIKEVNGKYYGKVNGTVMELNVITGDKAGSGQAFTSNKKADNKAIAAYNNTINTKYYSGQASANLKKDQSTYGTFSNGYQPKGISGYGEVTSTGTLQQRMVEGYDAYNSSGVKINGQKVWSTTNTDGKKNLWVWNGSKMTYEPLDSVTFKKK